MLNSQSVPDKPKTTVEQFELERQQMIESHLRARDIENERVLAAMYKVPRQEFVESSWQDFAYSDRPLPIDYNQTISQPYIVAYMTQAANITPGDKVLEIGTGCGYQTAILGEIAKQVYSVEIIPELSQKASQTLTELGYKNIQFKIGDGYQGWVEQAPYDAIIVTAAPQYIPHALIEQLKINGKMVIPVGTWHQDIVVLTKKENNIVVEKTIPVNFVPMIKKS